MEMLNVAHLSWEECRDENDSILITLDSCKEILELHDKDMNILKGIIKINDSSVQERDFIIAEQAVVIKHREQQIRTLEVHRGLLGTLAIVEAVIIGILIIK